MQQFSSSIMTSIAYQNPPNTSQEVKVVPRDGVYIWRKKFSSVRICSRDRALKQDSDIQKISLIIYKFHVMWWSINIKYLLNVQR